MIGRLRRRSTQVPTGSAKRSQGAIPAAVNIPNSSGVAPNTKAAIVGIAQPLNWPPNWDIVSDIQSLLKSA